MIRRAAALALLGLAPAQAAHAAGPPTMGLGDVRAGMSCTALSVVQGTTVTSFDAHVDEVISGGSDPSAARILVTVSGPAVDATGVGPGFSGSPVFCPGADGVQRIAGAISETIGSFGGKTVLATPIQAILREPVDPPAARSSARAARRASALLARARPIAEPISISGLSPAIGRAFQRAAARRNRVLVLAPLAPAQAPPAAPPLVPGSAIAAALATGDVEAGAVGTAAYVDGDTVWGFGHPMDGAGRRSLFLARAFVYGVVNNPLATQDATTYKIAAPTTVAGTLTQDGVSAVVGRIGAGPPAFPMQISVRDRDTRRLSGLRMSIADERSLGLPTGASALATIAPPALAQAIYAGLDGSPVRQSSELCLRVHVREQRRALGFCNTYVGGGGSADALSGGPLVTDAAAATQMLDAYDAGPLTVTGVEAGVRVSRGLRIARLKQLSGPATARRGGVVVVRATLRRPGGAAVRRTIRVPVPRTMPRGPRDLFLKGTEADVSSTGLGDSSGTTFDLSSLFESAGDGSDTGPTSVKELSAALSALHRYDGVTARFLPPGAEVPEQLPGGAERFAQRARRVFRDPDLRVSGRARLTVVVR